MNEVLFKILRKLASKPELVEYIEPTKVLGKIPYNEGCYYTIELCCEGYGVILTLPKNTKLDFSLTEEDREKFNRCMIDINKACRKMDTKLLLDYLQIETDSNSATDK